MTTLLIDVAYPKQASDYDMHGTFGGRETYDAEGYATRKTYTFFGDTSMNLEAGDLVVCPYGNRYQGRDTRFVVCKVMAVRYPNLGTEKARRWVVHKVDQSSYAAREARAQQIKELENKLQAEMAQARRELEVQLIFDRRPELQELQRQLDALRTA